MKSAESGRIRPLFFVNSRDLGARVAEMAAAVNRRKSLPGGTFRDGGPGFNLEIRERGNVRRNGYGGVVFQ